MESTSVLATNPAPPVTKIVIAAQSAH
jgi:hypothetical protein